MCINIDWCAPLNPRHLTFLGGITTFFPTTAMCQGKSRKNEHMYSLDIFICEVSPKFNCCKMEYPFILRFKSPLRFSMFGKRLSFKQFWLCLFLNGLRDFGCRAPFLALYFCLRSCKALFNLFLSLPCSTLLFEKKCLHVSTSGWTVFLILRLTRDCVFFPGKAMLQIPEVLQAVL